MIKFKLNSKGVQNNLHELLPNFDLTTDEVCELTMYISRLSMWWEYKYNSDQPVKIEVLGF